MREYFAGDQLADARSGFRGCDHIRRPIARSTDERPSRDRSEWWPLPNVWLGVSVENQEQAICAYPIAAANAGGDPVPQLRAVARTGRPHTSARSFITQPGVTRIGGRLHTHPGMLTGEPCIDWVIVGGESGAKARPLDMKWVFSIVAQCHSENVPVFVKQMGSVPMELETIWRGRTVTRLLSARNHKRVPEGFVPLKFADRKGGDPDEWPAELRVREYPKEVAHV
jgi:hypothetical protein